MGSRPPKTTRVSRRDGLCHRKRCRAIVMIALEANTLVRFIAQDHPAPTAAATKLIWVLQFSYRFDKREIEKVIER